VNGQNDLLTRSQKAETTGGNQIMNHSNIDPGNSMSRSSLRLGLLLIPLVLAGLALSPRTQAASPSPAPDGGYANNNTAEGTDALHSLDTGTDNTAIGFDALYSNTTGNYNTANGSGALYSNTTANENTAIGLDALFSNTTGTENTAMGLDALNLNTTGDHNTAIGYNALDSNMTGASNTAVGFKALYNNTTGYHNTANGVDALYSNTSANYNTANGFEALYSNTTGESNVANGFEALYSNTGGYYNAANGVAALYSNTTGSYNTANGFIALFSNTTGYYNAANGLAALYSNTTGGSNTASGVNALYSNTTGSSNIALGNGAGINLTTGSNNIDVGNVGVAAESNTIRIGGTQTNAFMAGIYNATVVKGIGVVVDSTGRLGTKGSSARFKDAIKPMDKTSEAILALKPVTFHYRKELDPEGVPQFGLIAEEVAKVNPDLVARDDEGKIYTVRYDAVNAMLLNEFLKQHKAFLEEHRKVEELEVALDAVNKRLGEQDSKIQKVSAQLEVTKPAPQMVRNNQ
jgi:trimeric autotransporter adhesin